MSCFEGEARGAHALNCPEIVTRAAGALPGPELARLAAWLNEPDLAGGCPTRRLPLHHLSDVPNTTMTMNLRLVPLLALLLALPFALTGCESMSNTGKGATIGAGGGAVAGAILGEILGGSPAKGAIIGAAVGGTAGAVIGSRIEEQAEELDEELENASVEPIMNPDTGEATGIQLVFDNALLFDVGASTLRPGVQADLRGLAASMVQYSDHDAVIVGHASTDGPDELNQRLSEQRATAVRSFLMSQGVAPVRLEAMGLGESQPLAGIPGTSPENRRVEIALYPNPNYVQQVQQQQGG